MNPVATVLVVVLLVSGMLAMGTSTSLRELAALARRPAALAIAVLVNLVAIPAAAFALLRSLDLDPTTSLALMVVAAAPGGGTGALLSLHVRGDRAHAVALQVILAVTSLVSAPLWLHLYADSGSTIKLGPLVAALLAFQWLPLGVGLALSERRPVLATRLHPRARRFADLMLAALIVVLVITSGADLDENGADALVGIGVVLALTLLGGAASLGTPAVRRATAMTTLVRNLSLALAAVAFVDDADGAAVLVLTYGLAMYLLAVAWVGVVRREKPVTPAG
ncbi:bile acid:sodium symporter family protein [Methylocystis sp.]|uniref:bile acid:sodium symporter family protein n=1 Tax=Methylocystis sp. TaxID=1911079 RepID=UPI003DA3E6E6